jgi:hypothetical protein
MPKISWSCSLKPHNLWTFSPLKVSCYIVFLDTEYNNYYSHLLDLVDVFIICIASLRSIVLNCLLTHKPSLRAAIQCFLLTAVCNLTNVVGKGSTIEQVIFSNLSCRHKCTLVSFTESLIGTSRLYHLYRIPCRHKLVVWTLFKLLAVSEAASACSTTHHHGNRYIHSTILLYYETIATSL